MFNLTCDQLYLLGNTNIIHLLGAIFFFACWLTQLGIHKQDLEKSAPIFDYIYQAKIGRIKYPLNIVTEKRLVILFNRSGKLYLDLGYPYILTLTTLILLYLTIRSYIDPVSSYLLSMTIIWYIFGSIVVQQALAQLYFLCYIYFRTSVYLQKKFTEINTKIKLFCEENNRGLIRFNLIDLIEEHNYFTKITADINKSFRLWIFVIYYIIFPSLSIAVYGVHHKETDIRGKIVAFGISCLIMPLLLVTFLSAWINRAAHLSYPIIFNYMSSIGSRLNIKTRFKVMLFVERLSGPDIGFYCYDLFPMNSYELYRMLGISAINYILLISLF